MIATLALVGLCSIPPASPPLELGDERWTAYAACDQINMPASWDIAGRFMRSGTESFESGIWRVTFETISTTSGDWATAFFRVTVRATRKPWVMRPVYFHQLFVQYGSTCMTSVMAFMKKNGKWHVEQQPSAAEDKRRHAAGECPDFQLRIWQVDK